MPQTERKPSDNNKKPLWPDLAEASNPWYDCVVVSSDANAAAITKSYLLTICEQVCQRSFRLLLCSFQRFQYLHRHALHQP